MKTAFRVIGVIWLAVVLGLAAWFVYAVQDFRWPDGLVFAAFVVPVLYLWGRMTLGLFRTAESIKPDDELITAPGPLDRPSPE